MSPLMTAPREEGHGRKRGGQPGASSAPLHTPERPQRSLTTPVGASPPEIPRSPRRWPLLAVDPPRHCPSLQFHASGADASKTGGA
jgi:hypothetical protein